MTQALVRPMAQGDLAAVLSVQHQSYAAAFHEPIEAFASKWAASPDTCWVAEHEGAVCAYLVCLPIEQRNLPALHATDFQKGMHPDWLYLHDLAIGPVARGTGLAPQLVERALARAQAMALPAAGLIAVQGSSAFWRRFGFEIDASERLVSARKLASFGADAVFMSRELGATA
ncbi:MAG: GNAT family N-acetyltransferase [Aquabacterium sp.]|uniref:GNAT family N-acetyltransferase n=1 Tax=Aquabacterium sp. TaxID=1872578 RepID=UPI0012026B4B|nr:GNAT family N-acetyltransferase [Aquabacterium sp.]TAK94027.1 MAG: GNAT family N-acetyltransferase [Aquabacterium sp.]